MLQSLLKKRGNGYVREEREIGQKGYDTMQKNMQKQKIQMSKHRNTRKNISLYLMLLPFLLYYILFAYKPMYGNVIAFMDYNIYKGIGGSEWVGLDNFRRFLTTPYFFRTFKNTIILNLYQLVFTFPAPIIFALFLNEVRCKKVKSAVQTLTYLPHFISTVVVAGIVINLLSPSYGIVSLLIEKISGTRPYLMSDPRYFRLIYTVMSIWQGMGYGSIVYLAAITSVDTQLYEAAAVDGANKLRRVWHITIPGIVPTIMTMLLIRVGSILGSSTDTVLLLYQPSTYEVADIIGTYVYREGLLGADYSYSTAVGLFNSFIGLLLVCGSNSLSKKFTESGLW